MAFELESAIAVLERTPAALDALLRGLPDSWTRSNEGADTWSAYDIVGHLVHGECTDWIPRARMILEHGEVRAFEPFDRFAQMRNREASLSERLDEFARLRRETVAALRALKLCDEDLERTGTHPELGRVTLRQLLATWTAHDLNHVHQLARVMARQYASDVGPWVQYLGVMRCLK
jgi:hypothetical protein